MKLPCPSCAQALNLPDNMAGKIVTCPGCRQNFVAPKAAPADQQDDLALQAASAVPIRADGIQMGGPAIPASATEDAGADADYELVPQALHEQPKTLPPNPAALEVCPECNARWKKGAISCKRCNYNAVVGAKLKAEVKRRGNSYFDYQKLFLYVGLLALAFGVYWVFNNLDHIKKTFDKGLDTTSGQPAAPNEQPTQEKKPKKAERGD
jgi:ribosomal protein L40E